MSRSIRFADITGAVAGVAFAVLVFLSVAAVDVQRGVTDGELQAWWANSGNRDGVVFSIYALLLAAPLFLLFVSRLRRRLRPGDAGGWSDVVFACGVVVTTALGVCAVLRGVVASSMRFDGDPLPGVDTLRFATYLAYSAWNLVILFSVVLIAVASLLALATRSLPRWAGWLGLLVAVGCAALLVVQRAPLSLPLLFLWVLATSVLLVRAPAAALAEVPAWQPEVSRAGA